MPSEENVPQRYDAVVIGGGHNGLISGAYLAKGGLKTLVLERREGLRRLRRPDGASGRRHRADGAGPDG